MGKSISTTSNTQNTPTSLFSKGDNVLCPSIGDLVYKLIYDKEYDCLGFITNGQTYHYRSDGKVSRDDKAPSLFHDTQVNRQAINTLYGSAHTTPSSQRKVIDLTSQDDDEAILISAFDLQDIACDINGAATILNDVSQLLGLIHFEKIDANTAISMARLTHDATQTWFDLLHVQLDSINDTLAMTGYGKEGTQ